MDTHSHQSRVFSGSYKSLLKSLSQTTVLESWTLSNFCYRLSVVNGKVCAPLPVKKAIKILDKNQSSDIVFKDIQPFCMTQISSTEMLIGSYKGLYVSDIYGEIKCKVCEARTNDIYMVSDDIVAIAYDGEKHSVLMCKYIDNRWVNTSTMSLKGTTNLSFHHTLICHNDIIYVTDKHSNICVLNLRGEYIDTLLLVCGVEGSSPTECDSSPTVCQDSSPAVFDVEGSSPTISSAGSSPTVSDVEGSSPTVCDVECSSPIVCGAKGSSPKACHKEGSSDSPTVCGVKCSSSTVCAVESSSATASDVQSSSSTVCDVKGSTELSSPTVCGVDSENNVLVCDYGNDRLLIHSIGPQGPVWYQHQLEHSPVDIIVQGDIVYILVDFYIILKYKLTGAGKNVT